MQIKITMLLALSCTLAGEALDPNYTLPPITYETQAEKRLRMEEGGKRLMSLMGIPDGDTTLVCTNWGCPTSIVVNAVRYDLATNWWNGVIEFDIMTTNSPAEKIATGNIEMKANGLEARLAAFIDASFTNFSLELHAQNVHVRPLDPSTNAMLLLYYRGALVYKNMVVDAMDIESVTNNPATNICPFAVAIINAGLPESERIALPPGE